MRIQGLFLDSRVGRRIFGLFCIAVLLPTLALSAILYRSLSDAARVRAEDALLESSKRYGLTLFERLDTADRLLARAIAGGGVPALDGALSVAFDRIARADAPAVAATTSGTGEPAAGIVRIDGAGGTSRIAIARAAGDGTAVVARLVPEYLWGARDEVAADLPRCVIDADGVALFCSGASPSRAREGAQAWELFLKGRFDAPSWSVVTFPDDVRANGPPLSRLLAISAAGALLLVLLLTLLLVRKTTLPLQELMRHTRQLGDGRYAPIRSRRRDEFGQLAHAFDDMGARVTHQLDTLAASSQVDRQILSRQPVTATVDVVAGRIRALLPEAAVCVWSPSTDGDMLAVLLHAGAGPARTLSCAPTPWTRQAATAPADGHRVDIAADAAGEPERTLAQAGARMAWVYPIGGREIDAWLALAVPGGAMPTDAALREARDLGERIAVAMAARRRELALVHQARHDALTGLPNRFAALDALHERLSDPKTRAFAVAFFDLDRFKAINDGLGHLSGDQVLLHAGRLLAEAVADAGFAARYGGDEFFVILDRVADREAAVAAALRIGARFAKPLPIERLQVIVSASIGVAMYPDDGRDAQTLVRHADIAMYRAKRGGGAQCLAFEPEMDREAVERVTLENDLRIALETGAIDVHFQPRVDARSGHIVAAEALARWQHPTRGPVPPPVFVALAEECGLIGALGLHVLERACRELAAWRRAGHGIGSVAVNVSSRQLGDDRFADHLRAAMARHGLGAGDLELEITESIVVEDLAGVTARLQRCRALGASIAVDDFGTGYSSLAYLRDLPVDTLKIDREFMRDIDTSAQAAALVRAMIAMAHALQKTVVAEGVESAGQVALLRAWDCPLMQGYAFHRPMGAPALMDLLAGACDPA